MFCIHISRQNDEFGGVEMFRYFNFVMCLLSILKFVRRINEFVKGNGDCTFLLAFNPIFAVWFTGMPLNCYINRWDLTVLLCNF
jgi:hypothetical protein